MSAPANGTAETRLDEIDLADRAVFRDGFPHALFATLRRDAPVWWHPARDEVGGRGFWVVSRHADIQTANRDTERFTADDGPGLFDAPERSGQMLTNMDGPAHVRMRKLISAGFTPRMTARLEEQARGWAVSIIEAALQRETCDFVHDLAYQLPMHMIADIMGIPEADRSALFASVNDYMLCTDPEYPVPAERRPELEAQMYRHARELGQEKRRSPRDDVWTILSTVEVDTEDGGRTALTDPELDFFFFLLTAAGSETTRNVITLGLLALLDHPDQLEVLRRDPDRMKVAVEEMIRWGTPISYFRRTVTRDTELGGVPLRAGDRVTLWYPSGNRDAKAFEAPFRFDLARSPNPHVSFGGGGPHFCLGAHLARREIAIFFQELLGRVASIEPLAPVRYGVQGIAHPITVSPGALPVRLKPAR